jgi:hypothetical protein
VCFNLRDDKGEHWSYGCVRRDFFVVILLQKNSGCMWLQERAIMSYEGLSLKDLLLSLLVQVLHLFFFCVLSWMSSLISLAILTYLVYLTPYMMLLKVVEHACYCCYCPNWFSFFLWVQDLGLFIFCHLMSC